MSVVRLDVGTMLELNAELLESDCIRPHPWEHYPFVVDGERQWVRYQNLQAEQKQVTCNALNKPCSCINASMFMQQTFLSIGSTAYGNSVAGCSPKVRSRTRRN